jgi:hypothetical protein
MVLHVLLGAGLIIPILHVLLRAGLIIPILHVLLRAGLIIPNLLVTIHANFPLPRKNALAPIPRTYVTPRTLRWHVRPLLLITCVCNLACVKARTPAPARFARFQRIALGFRPLVHSVIPRCRVLLVITRFTRHGGGFGSHRDGVTFPRFPDVRNAR